MRQGLDANFDALLNSILSLRKPDGTVIDGIKAYVSEKGILITDSSLRIEVGDKLRRTLPSGLEEDFIVDHPGYREATLGLPSHFQVKCHRLVPDDASSHPQDPVGNNPVPVGHPAQLVGEDATHEALEEVFQLNARMLGRPSGPGELLNWSIELAFLKYQIWARRNLSIVRTDKHARDYEQWLDNYLQAWVDSIGGKFPAAIPIVRAQLLQACNYWKGNAWAQVRAVRLPGTAEKAPEDLLSWTGLRAAFEQCAKEYDDLSAEYDFLFPGEWALSVGSPRGQRKFKELGAAAAAKRGLSSMKADVEPWQLWLGYMRDQGWNSPETPNSSPVVARPRRGISWSQRRRRIEEALRTMPRIFQTSADCCRDLEEIEKSTPKVDNRRLSLMKSETSLPPG